MFLEADLYRFYGVTVEGIVAMTWRRFQTLVAGLYGYEDSIFRKIQETDEATWKPSRPSPVVTMEGKEAEAFLRSLAVKQGG